jgi:hypothetical protein
MAAVESATITPMVVGTPRNLMASLTGGDDGGFDPSQPIYHVPGGVCGFAWVKLYARATESRKFVNWLKGSVKSSKPCSDVQPNVIQSARPSYEGGVDMWVMGFGQSMQTKEAYADAFTKVLREAEIDGLNVFSQSRMD